MADNLDDFRQLMIVLLDIRMGIGGLMHLRKIKILSLSVERQDFVKRQFVIIDKNVEKSVDVDLHKKLQHRQRINFNAKIKQI